MHILFATCVSIEGVIRVSLHSMHSHPSAVRFIAFAGICRELIVMVALLRTVFSLSVH